MEQSKAWKNRSKLLDSFDFIFELDHIGPEVWRDLYETKGLSAAQIAQKFGATKSNVIAILHQHGIRNGTSKGRSTRPDNYRAPSPPYGFKVRAGKLIPSPAERKVIKLIISLATNRGQNWSVIADELNRRRIPTKKGKGAWRRQVVRTTFKRWHNKI